MFDEWLREVKDRLLAGVARRLTGVSPLAFTLLAFAAGLLSASAILAGRLGLALALWLANRLLDGLDGAVARAGGTSSDLGAYLDTLLDFTVYAAIPLALAVRHPAATFPLLVLLAAFYVNAASWMYLAALLERRGHHAGVTGVVMPPGIVAGTETILFYSAAIVWPAHLAPIAWVMAALVVVGILQRVAWAANRL